MARTRRTVAGRLPGLERQLLPQALIPPFWVMEFNEHTPCKLWNWVLGIFFGNLYMVVHEPRRSVPRVRLEKTRKYIPPSAILAPKIRIFHSAPRGATEYNAIWSHKCGRDP